MSRKYSDAIRISRFLCILFMSYVHLHFFDLPGADFPIVEEVLVDTLGRSSVPLLSVISGYLMVSYFTKRPYLTAIRHRARSIIVPMIIWNGIAILIWGWTDINDLIALTGNSKLIYLTFLRDIFVMSIMTPLLLLLARRAPALLLGGASLIYVFDVNTIIILRPQILFFYVVGVLISLYPVTLRTEHSLAAVIILVLISTASALWPEFNDSHLFDAIVKRPVTALAFWSIALAVADRLPSLAALDRYVFPFFLAHGLIFWIAGAAYYRLSFLHSPTLYLFIWLMTPLLSFAGVAVLLIGWTRVRRVLLAGVERALSQ